MPFTEKFCNPLGYILYFFAPFSYLFNVFDFQSFILSSLVLVSLMFAIYNAPLNFKINTTGLKGEERNFGMAAGFAIALYYLFALIISIRNGRAQCASIASAKTAAAATAAATKSV